MSAIGKYFESLAANWNTPNFWSSEMKATTYVPDASANMTDEELLTNYNEVLWRLDFWSHGTYDSRSAKNVLIVINGYRQKLAGYQAIIDARQAKQVVDNSTSNSGDTTGTNTNTGGEVQPKKNNTLLWLLLGGGLLWYAHKRKLFKSK